MMILSRTLNLSWALGRSLRRSTAFSFLSNDLSGYIWRVLKKSKMACEFIQKTVLHDQVATNRLRTRFTWLAQQRYVMNVHKTFETCVFKYNGKYWKSCKSNINNSTESLSKHKNCKICEKRRQKESGKIMA
jgi:hypothetical protein